jgi:hypothetical protein
MGLFKAKDKNRINGGFISDTLIGLTLNLIGQTKDKTVQFLGNADFYENVTKEGALSLTTMLNNKCVLGISLEKDIVFKVNVWLNHKPSKEDVENLHLFYATHEDEYYY